MCWRLGGGAQQVLEVARHVFRHQVQLLGGLGLEPEEEGLWVRFGQLLQLLAAEGLALVPRCHQPALQAVAAAFHLPPQGCVLLLRADATLLRNSCLLHRIALRPSCVADAVLPL